jgi:hypothetical protein
MPDDRVPETNSLPLLLAITNIVTLLFVLAAPPVPNWPRGNAWGFVVNSLLGRALPIATLCACIREVIWRPAGNIRMAQTIAASILAALILVLPFLFGDPH